MIIKYCDFCNTPMNENNTFKIENKLQATLYLFSKGSSRASTANITISFDSIATGNNDICTACIQKAVNEGFSNYKGVKNEN